ncbi:MAG: capsular polysaccharide biosynthesis protein [Proteobacteria bacterium]|nr:capsular polysaccharide biosynthesis protein [Pseudomonadota bacterium]MBS0573529.1 capsular polysaccharide biosynthesis protein [Pseudomonadota bacterium]
MRRILTLAGYDLRLGLPGPGDAVGVWGMSPTAPRGESVARQLSRDIVRIEDAFLRSVRTGREGAAPLGLLIDRSGVHFASDRPSDLETLLARHPLDDTALLDRARTGMARLRAAQLSKYNAFDPALPAPDPGYVLVIDQTRGDASIAAGGARASTFREMLVAAQAEHPAARILIRTHPETDAGLREGHFGAGDAQGRIAFCDAAISPHRLLEGAVAVYSVSSQMGFEAILAGHRPRVFGQPFYAGWGLSDDENPVARRQRKLTRAQIFAGAMILYPAWYDPCRDRLCSFEEAVDQLEAETRAFRDDRQGHVATGMRLWKRGHLQAFFGRERPLRFRDNPSRAFALARAKERGLLVWASRVPFVMRDGPAGLPLGQVEDGFLRSRGLGAALIPPLSLILDRRGIYYDPARESDLEALIAAGPPPGGEARAERLVAAMIRAGLTKYNLPATALPDLPTGHRILVPGQVENDASLLCGGGEVRTNLALLERVRAENPGAVILWKPHPDVAAGLRPGRVPDTDARRLADAILPGGDPGPAIAAADEVWTMTSTLGFEALLRGKPVTCLGTPFYAGWGLTRDLGPVPARRTARPTPAALAHACLIAYPRYLDPATGLPCPPEVIVERLARGQVAAPRPGLRILSKLQGLLAGHARLWR